MPSLDDARRRVEKAVRRKDERPWDQGAVKEFELAKAYFIRTFEALQGDGQQVMELEE